MPDPREAAAANRMYWESDASVAEVAASFDLSRRALYQAIEPMPAGVECTECGSELVFENRLARQRNTATCPACCAVQDMDRDSGMAHGADSLVARFPSAREVREDARGADLRQRAVFLSGAAIAGIAIGTVATWLARRRD